MDQEKKIIWIVYLSGYEGCSDPIAAFSSDTAAFQFIMENINKIDLKYEDPFIKGVVLDEPVMPVDGKITTIFIRPSDEIWDKLCLLREKEN